MATAKKMKSKPETDERYAAALHLYRTTNISSKEICEQTHTPLSGFKRYLYTYHRELMFARYGILLSADQAHKTKLRESKGQSPAARAKYHDAIMACDDIEYIEYNISQIARIFHHSPGGLAQQLRSHFPEILERRERERHRLGVNDNFRRGAPEWCKEQYAEAIEHLRNSDDTIRQTAEKFNLSFTGLRGHLLYYHKELVEKREYKRKKAKGTKNIGSLTGKGTIHSPSKEQDERYEEAIRLYRTTPMTMKEIVETIGITLNGFRNYLRMWHIDLMLERRGITGVDDKEQALRTSKQYHKSTASKYAEAIALLKNEPQATAEVAKKFNLHPDCLREYLYEHEPELANQLGMTRLPNGKLVLARSAEKYEEAIRLYETTTEPLKCIARRLGITYNSLNGFVRRNYPDLIEIHNKLVEVEQSQKREQQEKEAVLHTQQLIAEEKKRIIKALKSTGNNRRQAAKLLGICKSTLYNKLKQFNID